MSASGSSFARNRIAVTFQLGTASATSGSAEQQLTFAESGTDTVQLTGLRCAASVRNSGGASQGELDLRVYGLTESMMNQLSGQMNGLPYVVRRNNRVVVQAGTDATGLGVLYSGNVSNAWANYDAAPEVFFHVLALGAYQAAISPVQASSYKGSVDAAVVLADIAKLAGMRFENSGVSGIMLSNPNYPGTALDQIAACAHAAGVNFVVDGNTLAIWPKGGSRQGAVPEVSPASGLIGYPIITPSGIELRTRYNPALVFGSTVKVQSSRAAACGTWLIVQLNHTLESETPDGAWFSHVTCYPFGNTGR